jgi:membrane carboxypeptidase/penicillin-binding protein PbpC
MVLRLVDGMAANQRLTLRAESGAGVLYWFVDDQLAATAPAAESASWPLARGRHVIVCCDAAGRSARAEIVVE